MPIPETINVVGAGLAGSLVAHLLRSNGFTVRVIDDNDPFSGSKASSNLFIASWLKKFSSAETACGLAVLERLFGANELAIPAITSKIDKPFSGGIAAAGKVRHIHQKHILVEPDIKGKTISVDSDRAYVSVDGSAAMHMWGTTILCTGYRAAELIPGLKVEIKVGHALYIHGRLSQGQSRLSLVSPYVHQKLYQYDDDTVYYADSVAVSPERYLVDGPVLLNRTKARAAGLLGVQPIVKEVKVGFRPIIPGHDFGLAQEVMKNVFVINGGGKNGMVAYANAASKIVEILKQRRTA